MKILQLCTYDRGGGAERVAIDLHQAYLNSGHDAKLLVKFKHTMVENVVEVDTYKHTAFWSPLCAHLEHKIRRMPRFKGQYQVVDLLRGVSYPKRFLDRLRGIDDFNYPYSRQLAKDSDWHPDIIHMHNLHGNYFDLAAIELVSQKTPVVWTLHDTWAFTGHCGHFIDCQRWKTGCGQCPDLKRPPAIYRDATAKNWARKKSIYARARLHVATPSRWLMTMVSQSMLIHETSRVINNGVDLSVFCPGDQAEARSQLEIAPNTFVVLYVASSRKNPYKDYQTIKRVIEILTYTENTDKNILLICLGGTAQSESDPRFRYPGTVSSVEKLRSYYRAADVLVHGAIADNFPLVVLEAQACGVPVVASAVGGIPEEIIDGETGYLAPRGNPEAMAAKVLELMNNPKIKQRMGQAGSEHVRNNFSLQRQVSNYLQWFEELIQ